MNRYKIKMWMDTDKKIWVLSVNGVEIPRTSINDHLRSNPAFRQSMLRAFRPRLVDVVTSMWIRFFRRDSITKIK